MKLNIKETPRSFKVGMDGSITLHDMGSIDLAPDEQVTFVNENGQEYDVCRKAWGYYATPSINDRLRRFGYKTALVKNAKGQGFIMLVEDGKEELFFEYLKEEDNILVSWLDEEFELGRSEIEVAKGKVCPVCKSSAVEEVAVFDKKPDDENDFAIDPYHRSLKCCQSCGHLFNIHDYDVESFYSGHYAQSVYSDEMQAKFEKIINLPEDKSDNKARVQRVQALLTDSGIQRDNEETKVLDIGSGLCVFLHELSRQTSWQCTALDPDKNQAAHARDVCKVEAVTTDVMEYAPQKRYDFVSLNKVLEHFEYPEKLLEKMRSFLPKDEPGYVYIEVPDGEYAARESYEREEFFIEHFHAFSFKSLFMIMMKSGYEPLQLSRIREPSGKYTLYCFAAAKGL